jgi:hypothetical protein
VAKMHVHLVPPAYTAKDLPIIDRKIQLHGQAAVDAARGSVLPLTDDSQIDAELRVCADEEDRADFGQRG